MRSLLMLVLFFLSISRVWGCTCDPDLEIGKFAKWADVVYIGKVTKVDQVGKRSIATFQVTKIYKGIPPLQAVVVIHRMADSGRGFGCKDQYFEPNQEYLVLAKKYSAKIWLKGQKIPQLPGVAIPRPYDEVLGAETCAGSGRSDRGYIQDRIKTLDQLYKK